MTLRIDRLTTLIVKSNVSKISSFQLIIIGKKNNQLSVPEADREILTLESKDNAGNSVNLISGIIRLPSGWDSLSASETNDKFYLSLSMAKFTLWRFYAIRPVGRAEILLEARRNQWSLLTFHIA